MEVCIGCVDGERLATELLAHAAYGRCERVPGGDVLMAARGEVGEVVVDAEAELSGEREEGHVDEDQALHPSSHSHSIGIACMNPHLDLIKIRDRSAHLHDVRKDVTPRFGAWRRAFGRCEGPIGIVWLHVESRPSSACSFTS